MAKNNISNLKISNMTLEDLEAIKPILQKDFDEFWNYQILKEEIVNTNSSYFVAKSNNIIIGFAGVKQILDEANIMNIVTRKDSRNSGIATSLLKKLIDFSKKTCTTITLEVNENNKIAIHLYEKFGFKNVGLRKKYYSGIDNAIIMTLYF